MVQNAYIIDAVRTPRARRKGKLSSVHPVDLLATTLRSLPERHSFDPEEIDDVAIGCVTQVNEQAWCVGRKAVLAAGWPHTVPATTLNRLCASGLQAVNLAQLGIGASQYSLAIAGGLEHMTRVPMFSDTGGEESPGLLKYHPDLVPQGLAAELIAQQFSISRERADEYSFHSQMRAHEAASSGFFAQSIIPVSYVDEEGNSASLAADDTIRSATTAEALASLKPVFKEDGIITAGNASAIVDGAAAVLLADMEAIKKFNLNPRARIVSTVAVGSDPKLMLTGPVAACRKLLQQTKLSKEDIDLWEINEAFAPVPLLVMDELALPHEVVNVNGGGISLGHPLGATGAMLVSMGLDELERRGLKRMLITLCIGLGMAMAMVVERV